MKSTIALIILAVCLVQAASAYSLNDSSMEASQLVKESFDVGFMCGILDAKASIAQLNEAERPSYNRLVDKGNAMIQEHNQLMIILFSENTTALDELLVPTYDYV